MEEINTIGEFDKAVQFNELINKTINVEVSLPYIPEAHRKHGRNSRSIEFENCIFSQKVTIGDVSRDSNEHREWIYDLVFKECQFQNIVDAENSNLDAKIRFRKCQFENVVNFRNTTFNLLADFWQSTFDKPIIFYKTDFMATTVFSGVTFKSNVLFTYTLVEKLIIFRGTIFKKGLDLSLSIISGSLSVFDIQLENFKSDIKYLIEEQFENLVSKDSEIPIKNKRETFRILKKYFENNSNVPESLRYRVREKITLFKETFYELVRFSKIQKESIGLWNIFKLKFKAFFNLFVLSANYVSNHFGVAYIQSILFTLFVGAIGYYLTILHTEKYIFDLNFEWSILKENIPGYANFLIPTHKFSFLGEDFYSEYKISNWFYVFDMAGRIAVGYGIYQTIQAFRKFR